MLQYLIILLDDTSVSYCHYSNLITQRRLIGIDDLKQGIIFSMKENLNVQFVYPNYQLPKEYQELIDMVDHTNIGPMDCGENIDIVVTDNIKANRSRINCLLWRCSLEELSQQVENVKDVLKRLLRLNVVLTDIPQWQDKDFKKYESVLSELSEGVFNEYKSGKGVQLNILTDRIMLGDMNNCNAGDSNITLAPNGYFYVCPAFYYENPTNSIGSIREGLEIKNPQLYHLDHAPLCRCCDAYQCKRCVWMNQRLTMDCNTPSHQQCVASHTERNASRNLQIKMEEQGIIIEGNNVINEIDYLDPFNKYEQWKQEKMWDK